MPTDIADSLSPETPAASPPLVTPLTWVVAALLVVCFAPYLQWMWRIWMKSEYYSHGPLIPLLSAYIVYSKRHEFARAPAGRYHLWGAPIVLVSLALHGLATFWDVNFPQGFAMIGVIGGLTLMLWGWERTKLLAFPIIFLCFMVPVDRLLVTKLSNPLQLGSARVAASVPQALGVPVQIHGTIIEIPDYTFEVAQACSGLKSTIAMSALAALFAYLVVAPMWKRLVLFVSGVPVALLANASRISLTLLLGKSFGPAAAEGFFHSVSGIMVFLVGLVGLFLVAKGLRCDTMRNDIF